MTAKVLIIDDEDPLREDLATFLRKKGLECRTAPDGEAGLSQARDFGPDVILCDIVMPGKSGIDLLDEIVQTCPESSVVMITAYGTLESAVEAFRKGASDYIMKPLILEDVLRKIERLIGQKRLLQEVKFLRRQAASKGVEILGVVGQSEAMARTLDLVRKVAPTKSTVLITGESGTGKELVARAIHGESHPGGLPFVAINCLGIPENLMESELFGHLRGAFTGAVADREGFFELAGEGTIFLDEIAEMPLVLQGKLLRVLEQREFIPVGGSSAVPVKARIIASTNRDLRSYVEERKFREDLFFRIAVFEIPLPPLRERRSDIPLLVEHFVNVFNNELKRQCLGASNDAMRHILSYSWPGNVRELRNVIERAMILHQEDRIKPVDLPSQITNASQSPEYSDDLRQAMRFHEKEHIRKVLQASGGNKEETARRLGIDPSTLYRKLPEG